MAVGISATRHLPSIRRQTPQPSGGTHSIARTATLFRRALGAVYLMAFLSLLVQLRGLFGAHGILPLATSLEAARGRLGVAALWHFPSVFWFSAGDAVLLTVALVGIAAAFLMIADRFRRTATIVAWLTYLSFVTVGTPFLHYQWDTLLLETGFLAIWLALAARGSGDYEPETVTVWAFRFLLFRLMFASGMVKILSGDPTWRQLSALSFHYETQPLPTPIAWYLHQLPTTWQRACCAFTFIVECGLPWLVFAGRRARAVAAAGFALLQILILVSGNYGFFNWLTLALCLWWIDDTILPSALRNERGHAVIRQGRMRTAAVVAVMFLGALALCESLVGVPDLASTLVDRAESWGIVGHYGLFAVMTTERDELEIQGSEDGRNWRAYELRWKPGPVDRSPPWVEPHMPRLDWQMWFAALDPERNGYWLVRLVEGLRAGEPVVLGLLGKNPFPEHPPAHLRLARYRYTFTRPGSSDWWNRTLTGTSQGD